MTHDILTAFLESQYKIEMAKLAALGTGHGYLWRATSAAMDEILRQLDELRRSDQLDNLLHKRFQ
jgi:hypothetical protein